MNDDLNKMREDIDRQKLVLNNHSALISKLNEYWSSNVNDVEDINSFQDQIMVVLEECLKRLKDLS